jgi:hypothetical protein
MENKMKYKVTLRFGKYKVGDIVDDSELYIRRKLAEGGCLELLKDKQTFVKENKMIKDYENKDGK